MNHRSLAGVHWEWIGHKVAPFLPVWFVICAIPYGVNIIASGGLGTDGLLYYRAGVAFLNGGDPWAASHTYEAGVFHFYALPTTVLMMVPFTLVPESYIMPIMVGIQAAAAVYAVRKLNLAWWWLAFPPIVLGVLAGNPSLTVLALLLAPSTAAHALAPLVKVYAGAPLVGDFRWRAILMAAGITLVSVVAFPDLWGQFLHDPAAREARLMRESAGGFSAYRNLGLLIATLAALLVIARSEWRMAAWIAPIAIWPASQVHWATLALPVWPVWALAPLALHIQQLPPFVVIAYAIVLQWRRVRSAEPDELENRVRGLHRHATDVG